MTAPVELIVIAFDDKAKASEALKDLRKLKREGAINILNAAVLEKDENGKTKMHETEDVDAPRGAIFGAVVGGLIGIIGGPAGAIAGATIGAGIGGVTAHNIDLGFPDDQLKALQEKLTPNSSAILALVEHEWVEQLNRALQAKIEQDIAEIFQLALEKEIVEQLETKVQSED